MRWSRYTLQLGLLLILSTSWSQQALASFHFGIFGGIERANLDASLNDTEIDAKVSGGIGGLTVGYRVRLNASLRLQSALLYTLCPCEQSWVLPQSDDTFELEKSGFGLELGLSWLPGFISSKKSFALELGLKYATGDWDTSEQKNEIVPQELNESDIQSLDGTEKSLEPYVGLSYFIPIASRSEEDGSSMTWLSNMRIFLRYYVQLWNNTKVEAENYGGQTLNEELSQKEKQQFLLGVAVEVEP